MNRSPVAAVTRKPALLEDALEGGRRERLLHPVAVMAHSVEALDKQGAEKRIEPVGHPDDGRPSGPEHAKDLAHRHWIVGEVLDGPHGVHEIA